MLKLIDDKEIDGAFDGAFDKPISLDHKPTPEEIILLRLKAVAQAQLEADIKVYNRLVDVVDNMLDGMGYGIDSFKKSDWEEYQQLRENK